MKIPILIACSIALMQPLALKSMDANVTLAEDAFELNAQLKNAIMNGDTKIITLYLEQGGDVERTIKPNRTPLLMHACWYKKLKICELLLDAHANPNAIDKNGTTPLMQLWDEEICKILIDAKANVNATNYHGKTPLITAANEGITKLLLDAKAEVNAQTEDGENALYDCESPEQCRLLLQANADVNIRNNHNETPLFGCIVASYFEEDDDQPNTTELTIQKYQLLLDARADINAQCNDGYTVLLHEIQNQNEKTCKFLLSQDASIQIITEDGTTPFLAAAKSRKKAICKMLVHHQKELDRGLIVALHCIKRIKVPFLSFLYRERNTLLRPYMQLYTLAALLTQTDNDGKCPYDLFRIHCLIPKKLQFSDDDSEYDSKDGTKNKSNNRFNENWLDVNLDIL